MDKGAHFCKTDFQIHSPRDNQWIGDGKTQWLQRKPVSSEERLTFARKFIAKCRSLKIGAVGITDHHDICFVKYFQFAAQEHKVATGDVNYADLIVDPAKQSPIIFPGVEVTLQLPCQCIVLLDADSGPTVQAELLQAIEVGNTHSDDSENGPQVIPINLTLLELDNKLRTYAHGRLTGKYVILPHVGDGGHKTILRSGFNCHYAQMPCVGGYIENDWESHDKKHLLDGNDRNYGNKSLGVFQTTDSRREDFMELGKRNTWVKFAAPTAEAIRQACLAKESRISQIEPILPSRYISKIEVTNSRFMGNIDVDFNPQYNALIGGRGTGKSTILEYIRYGLHDQELSEYRRKFINDTLISLKPTLTIHWMIEGTNQKIVHDFEANSMYLQVEGGLPQTITEEYIKQNFPIQSYSQKQLSTVSDRTEELQRFIIQPIQEDVEDFDSKINFLREKCRKLYQEVIQRRQKERAKGDLIAQKESQEAQKEVIQKSIPSIDDETKKVIDEYPKKKQDLALVESWEKAVNIILNDIEAFNTHLSIGLSLPEGAEDITSEIDNVLETANKLSEKVRVGIDKLQQDIAEDIKAFHITVIKYKAEHANFLQRYENASQKTLAHKSKIQLLKIVMDSLSVIGTKITEIEKEIKTLENADTAFLSTFDEWVSLHSQKAILLEEQCRLLTEKSGNEIRAELRHGADIKDALDKLSDAIKGARVSLERWENLTKTIVEDENPVEKWTTLVKELRYFAETEAGEVVDENKIPSFSFWDLTPNARNVIIEKLNPDRWFEIAFTSLNDVPKFYYQKNRDAIPFEKASAGQQATSLLKVLLHEERGPLLIDQPEDDLDKKVMEEIIQSIWQAKQKRQLIFASHDANLVVNGDAELVVHCDYESETSRNKGKIDNAGSIDIKEIRDIITTIMEGGQRAFDLRKQKYGF